jgi:hypothetical protein
MCRPTKTGALRRRAMMIFACVSVCEWWRVARQRATKMGGKPASDDAGGDIRHGGYELQSAGRTTDV